MNINSIDSTTNFKAKLIVDAKLAKELPGIDFLREVAENVKSADFIRIRKSMNNRYLPRHDMYVVVAEKVAKLKPSSTFSYPTKHFIGTHSTLLDKNTSGEVVLTEVMNLLNYSLYKLGKKIANFKEKNPGVIKEDTGFFQNVSEKIKSFLKR